MSDETYQALRPVVREISEAAATLGPASLLRRWRRWSRNFCSGSIGSRGAFIAADTADFEATHYEASDPRRQLARAGAAAAWAAFYLDNPRLAQAHLVIARALAAKLAQFQDRQCSIVAVPSTLGAAPRPSRS